MPFKYQKGQFVYNDADLKKMETLISRVSQSRDKEAHEMLAFTIIPAIKLVIDYEEWTAPFFKEYPVDLQFLPRIAQDSPSMAGFYTSPTGEASFIRPGRTTYVVPSLSMIDTALEIGWDDMAMSGWNILQRKIEECGFELARKRDDLGKTVLDAACDTIAGHNITVTGGKMTKAAVDSVIRASALSGWKIDRVVLNPRTFMDMTDWTWSSSQHLWQFIEGKEGELLNNLSVSNYGGMTWNTRLYCPTNKVYFAGSPDISGAYRWTAGGIRTASDIDIKKRTDLHVWDQKLGHTWLNSYNVRCLTITD